MIVVRGIIFMAAFLVTTIVYVFASLLIAPFSAAGLRATVEGWADAHAALARWIVGIDTKVEGEWPKGAHLLAVKHETMYETLEVLRLAERPMVVMKREIAYFPLFGKVTRLYGVIPVDRNAGAKALRAMVAEGRKAAAEQRAVAIFPEGTRVRRGTAPVLRPGFAGLYRTLGLPVIPIAVDSGLFWSRNGLPFKAGTVTFKVGEAIPPGLSRDEIERRVHLAINALNPVTTTLPS